MCDEAKAMMEQMETQRAYYAKQVRKAIWETIFWWTIAAVMLSLTVLRLCWESA